MPISRFTRGLRAAIVTGALDVVHKVVSFNGFRYGSLGEVPGAPGISSSAPRTAVVTTLIAQEIDWRGASAASVGGVQLSKVGPVASSLDRGQEFSFEWSPTANTEDIVGGLAQADVTYGLVQPNVPTTGDHGYVVDSCGSSATGNSIIGLMQKVTPGGTLSGRTFTFSVYVAVPTPLARTFAQNVRLFLGTAEDPPTTPTQGTQSPTSYAIGRTTYLRCTKTFTFGSSPSNPTELMVVCSAAPVSAVVTPLLFAAAQLEEAGAATAYERTSTIARGVRNLLLGSHFPARAPWTVRNLSGFTVTVNLDAGRGPEVRAIVPTPGTVEFGSASTGVNVGNGLVQLRPYDEYGQVADHFASTAAGRCGIYKGVPRTAPNAADKTYIASAWVRRKDGGNSPATVGIMLSPWVAGVHQFDDIKDFPLTRDWRRIWWKTYVNSSYTTVDAIEAFFFSNDAASAKDTEWFGFQLEEVAGDNPRPPLDYEPTTSAAGAVNLVQRSSEADNAYWAKQACTVTANTGFAPIEYYDVLVPDLGASLNRLRVNPGAQTPATDWHAIDTSSVPAFQGDKLDFDGQAYSIGAYGTELMGAAGDFPWSGGALAGGWVVTGGTQYFLQTTGAPLAWIDDEETAPQTGVRALVDNGVNPPARYISNTVTLAVGWHTVRLRVARVNTNSASGAVLALQYTGDSKYLGKDWVSWPDTTARWLKAHTRNQGWNSPDFGVSVWHVYVPTAGVYNIRLAGLSAPASEILFDQLRIWSDAGALHASTDRTETAGNTGFLVQGFNVLFRGVVDDSVEADDTKIKIRCRDYIHGTAQQIPQWTAQPSCQVKFRGAECGYLQTTTITVGEGSPTTTHTVASTANLEKNRYILDSAGTSYTKIVTILSGTQFTTDVAQTYANGQAIIYADCKHTYPDCFLRQRTHRYSGCRATQALQAQGGTPLFRSEIVMAQRQPYDWHRRGVPSLVQGSAAQLLGALSVSAQDGIKQKQVFDDNVIPLVYGRKSIKCIPVETHATKFSSPNDSEWLTTFYLMGMGELADVRAFFTQDGPITSGFAAPWLPSTAYTAGVSVVMNDVFRVYICIVSGTSAASGGPTGTGLAITDGTVQWKYLSYLPFSIHYYWHPGLQGTDDWWTQAQHYAANHTPKIPNQSRDFRTNTDNAYNRMAYAIIQMQKGSQNVDLSDPTKIIDLSADLKGRLVQVYDANGLAVGSKAWSRNPIWIAVDGLRDGIVGPALPHSCFNWPVLAASAAVCDVVLTSPVAVTQAASVGLAGFNHTAQAMVGIDGFTPEMNVTITHSAFPAWLPSTAYTAGTSYVLNASRLYVCITSGTSAGSGGPTTTASDITDGTAHWQYLSELTISRLVKFVDPINLRLFFDSAFTAYTGDAVQGFPKRYTCDLLIDSKIDLRTFLDSVMGSCRGFLAFDCGKLGIYIEVSPADASATTWAIATPTPATTLLGVIPGSVKFLRPTFGNYNVLELTYEDAQLLAGSNRVLKFYDADRGGRDFPRPLKLEATGCDTAEQALRAFLPRFAKVCSALGGLGATQDVRGTAIESGIALLPAQIGDFVTVARPGRTTSQKSRIRSISIDHRLRVQVETMPEVRSIRPEGFTAPFDPFTDTPLIGTAMGSPLALGNLTISVTQSSGAQLHAEITVSGYSAGPGTSAGLNLQRFLAYELHVSQMPGFLPTTGRIGMGGTLAAIIDGTMTEFVWVPPRLLQEVQLYVKAVGLQGGVNNQVAVSNEVPIVIYRIDRQVSDPTQQERSNFANQVYDGGFRQPDAQWISDAASPTYPGNLIFAASIGNPVSPNIKTIGGGATNTYQTVKIEDNTTSAGNPHLGKLSDALDSTYFMHTSTFQGPLPGTYVVAEGQLWNLSPAWVASTAYTAGIHCVLNASRVYRCITSGTSAASGGPTTTGADITDGTAHWKYIGEAGANKIGRPYFRYLRPSQAAGNLGSISFYYSLDVTIGTPVWVLLADAVGSPDGVGIDFTGPELTGVDYTKFSLGVRFAAAQQTGTGVKTSIHRLLKTGFEQKASSAYAGSISGGVASLYGDGTNYGNLRRPFPGRVPIQNQVVFNPSTLGHVAFEVKKQVATDTLDANPLEIRLFDEGTGNNWTLDLLPSSEITSAWQGIRAKFAPASAVVGGSLQIELRTKNTKVIDVRRLAVYRGDTLSAWTPSPEEQANGFQGDFSAGEPTSFTKGSWVAGDRKKSPVS